MNNYGIPSDPHYAENPADYFFELFVIDTIEPLPREQADWVATTIKADKEQWRVKIKSILTLSDTIEIAILDLWYRNSEIARSKGMEYTITSFAQDFVDNYWAEGSLVDVWAPGALEDAEERIRVVSGAGASKQ
jgi:hypothetical protein